MISRRLAGEPWYNDTLRAAIDQHIEDNSNRNKDFIVGNAKDFFLMYWNGVWDENCEIQAFSKIYNVIFNIHD